MTTPDITPTAAGPGPRREAKPTVAGRLAADLRENILSARLAPGERLNLDQMRAAEGVSVSAMREAVGRLVADGLIAAESQRGYRVAPISRANLAEITTLRAALEPMALRRSLANGGLEWRTEVAAAHFRLSRTPRSAADPATLEAWEAAHDAFHAALIGRCGMPLLLRFHRQLMAMNDRYRRILLADGAGQRGVAAEHDAIAEAATAGDAEAAARLLAAHIEGAGARLRALIEDRLPETSG